VRRQGGWVVAECGQKISSARRYRSALRYDATMCNIHDSTAPGSVCVFARALASQVRSRLACARMRGTARLAPGSNHVSASRRRARCRRNRQVCCAHGLRRRDGALPIGQAERRCEGAQDRKLAKPFGPSSCKIIRCGPTQLDACALTPQGSNVVSSMGSFPPPKRRPERPKIMRSRSSWQAPSSASNVKRALRLCIPPTRA